MLAYPRIPSACFCHRRTDEILCCPREALSTLSWRLLLAPSRACQHLKQTAHRVSTGVVRPRRRLSMCSKLDLFSYPTPTEKKKKKKKKKKKWTSATSGILRKICKAALRACDDIPHFRQLRPLPRGSAQKLSILGKGLVKETKMGGMREPRRALFD